MTQPKLAPLSGKLNVSLPSDREVVLTRNFDAPRELVFRALTDPTLIPNWWGPAFLTTLVIRMDVRPGGKWRFVQRDPDGNEYAFNGEYLEVVPPSRIVQTFEFEPMAGHISTETLTLEEHGGITRMTIRIMFKSKEDRDGMASSGMEAGASESYDRLDKVLELLKNR